MAVAAVGPLYTDAMAENGGRRFDSIETVLIAGLAFAIGGVLFQIDPLPELRLFEEAYGPGRESRGGEEWLIRDFFGDRRDGVFVDVGASHYKNESNTYYLETALGWSGLAIEPLAQYAAEYRRFRPKTTFLPFFVSDQSDQTATLFFQRSRPELTSSRSDLLDAFGASDVITAPTATLNDLLANAGIERFDFLNMDIELHEPQALAGFDLNRARPALVCIEANARVRQEIIEYFARNDYIVVGKYLRADPVNLYFRPAAPLPPETPGA